MNSHWEMKEKFPKDLNRADQTRSLTRRSAKLIYPERNFAMKPYNAQTVGRYIRISLTLLTLLALAVSIKFDFVSNLASATSSESIPNNQPVRNPNGKSATFSTQGSVNLTGEYFQAQGTNGRSCASATFLKKPGALTRAHCSTCSMKRQALIQYSTCLTRTIQMLLRQRLRSRRNSPHTACC